MKFYVRFHREGDLRWYEATVPHSHPNNPNYYLCKDKRNAAAVDKCKADEILWWQTRQSRWQVAVEAER